MRLLLLSLFLLQIVIAEEAAKEEPKPENSSENDQIEDEDEDEKPSSSCPPFTDGVARCLEIGFIPSVCNKAKITVADVMCPTKANPVITILPADESEGIVQAQIAICVGGNWMFKDKKGGLGYGAPRKTPMPVVCFPNTPGEEEEDDDFEEELDEEEREERYRLIQESEERLKKEMEEEEAKKKEEEEKIKDQAVSIDNDQKTIDEAIDDYADKDMKLDEKKEIKDQGTEAKEEDVDIHEVSETITENKKSEL